MLIFHHEESITPMQPLLITPTSKISEIITNYPYTNDFFRLKGFPVEKKQFSEMANIITLQTAISMKKMDLDQFINDLESYITLHQEYGEQVGINAETDQIQQISGALPCVVQLPLQNELDHYLKVENISVQYHFQSASQGTYDLPFGNTKPAIYIGAGLIPFRTQSFIQHYMQNPATCPNSAQYATYQMHQFKDPKDQYHIISVIPMVMVINTKLLNGKPVPDSWQDLTNPIYHNLIAYPNEDQDLKNLLLVYFFKLGGGKAVQAFAKNCMLELHPSQMIKSKRLANQPAIMIMPHFFAKLALREKEFFMIWPDDGAFCVPLLLIANQNMTCQEENAFQFFFSKQCGDVFQNQGFFPSTHQDVNNELPGALTWIGWDYIYQNDMPELMQKCEQVFDKERKQ
jgi:ABC-type Fe3+ transport system substrate-binding protein